MLGGFCKSSFIGFPVVHALYGDSGLRIALIIDQLGSFLAVSTVGIFVATIFGSTQTGPFDWKIPALRVIRFPPFIATVIALVLSFWGVPPLLQPVFDRLGQTLAPLALVSIGFTLKFDLQRLKAWAEPLAYGLLYKLALAPLLITAVALGLGFDRHSQIFQVTVLEAAMASMMTAGIIAEQQGLDSELISLMYGVGIPLSGLTLTCVYWLL
jgi:predicted permease